MKRKFSLAIVFCIAAIVAGLLYFYAPPGEVNLLTFDYASVTSKEDFPKVNVTGVIDGICIMPDLYIYNMAGGEEAGGKVAINVQGCPGTPMIVSEIGEYEGETWYRVQKFEIRDDMQMWWDGWTTDIHIRQGPLPVRLEDLI